MDRSSCPRPDQERRPHRVRRRQDRRRPGRQAWPPSGVTKAAGAAVATYVAQRRTAGARRPPPPPAARHARRPQPGRTPPRRARRPRRDAAGPRPTSTRPVEQARRARRPADVAKVVAREAAAEGARHQGAARSPRRSRCPAPSCRPASAGPRTLTARRGPPPDPALVVLVGASGLGQVHLGRGALPARGDRLLRRAARRGRQRPARPRRLRPTRSPCSRPSSPRGSGRGLTTVVDTLGLDAERRAAWLAAARGAGLPAVAVVFATPDAECRRRNAARDRPVPAPGAGRPAQADARRAPTSWPARAGTSCTRSTPEPGRVPEARPSARRGTRPRRAPTGARSQGLEIVLQVSRFPWGEDPAGVAARASRWPPTRPGSPGSR